MSKLASWLIGIAVLVPALLQAQSTSETALLFSRTSLGGSARIQAMGGAQTALGGDFSSALSNPAGLGMFNRSEISITPGYFGVASSASYLNNDVSTNRTNVSIPGLSFVFHSNKEGRKGLLSGTFAITFNRINNFNSTFNYQGRNDKNSIIDFFIADATGFDPDTFKPGSGNNSDGENYDTPTGLAYNNYLIEDSTFINPAASRLDYLSVLGTFNNPNDVRSQWQEEEVRTGGAQNQWNFSYGVNLSDRFFLGAGVGFASIRFESEKRYRESQFRFALAPNFNPLNSLELREELRISGSGVNANFGSIIRPVERLQVGISYTTPTLYSLSDTYTAGMVTDWNGFDYFGDGSNILNQESQETNIVTSDYTLRTPGRLNVGATFFFGKKGFITSDVQMVNYSSAKYNSLVDGLSYDNDNARIRNLYQPTVNYRVGGELRLNSYRVRLGYSLMSDPFATQQNGVSRTISQYSTGVGYRTSKFYLDAAVLFAGGDSSYRPYRVNSQFSPLVRLNNTSTSVLVTLGFPF